MARLDRLDTAKSVAQLGATIGRQFSYELLRALSSLDEGTLQQELGRLVEVELLYQRGMPPQATYTFKHALIQDAAYQSLLRRTQQSCHHQIAQLFPAPWRPAAAHWHAVCGTPAGGAGAQRRRRGVEKGFWNAYPSRRSIW
jgi:hypothetical protein